MTRRSYTREQLLGLLEILGPLHDPLSPALPPSPPPSRMSSPSPSAKRKLDVPSVPSHDPSKRPRTLHPSDRQLLRNSPLPSAPSLRPSQHIARTEPCEDGELCEEPLSPPMPHPPLPALPSTTSAASPSMLPVRRPKRGKTDSRYHDALHDRYHDAGRKLKYSGDARFWSTYPTTHKEYRPLAAPPPPTSPYHKYGGLIARLELVDALVCFTYAIWNKDYGRKNCYRATWATIDAFLSWCKQKWLAEEGILDAEKAFIGLIFMIEGFINARKLAYMAISHLDKDISLLYEDTRFQIAQAATKAEQDHNSKSDPVPSAMLPSPASIAPTSSANSTPNNSTPDVDALPSVPPQRAPCHPGQCMIPEKLLPERFRDSLVPAHVMDEMTATRADVSPSVVQNLKEQTVGTIIAGQAVSLAQNTLNISTLFRFFPNTFSRIIYSTLSATEEHEPDFEDEEGELFWPGQCINGEGLGWICLMGKAMIKEFGNSYGYRGLDGVVPKPKPGQNDRKRTSVTQPPQKPDQQGYPSQGQR